MTCSGIPTTHIPELYTELYKINNAFIKFNCSTYAMEHYIFTCALPLLTSYYKDIGILFKHSTWQA